MTFLAVILGLLVASIAIFALAWLMDPEEAARRDIKEFEASARIEEEWIPVTVRMPGHRPVQCLSEDGKIFQGIFDYDFQKWIHVARPHRKVAVTHWRACRR